ncbi:MAG: signal peptidase I [Acidobacteriota bacterium]
MLTKRKKLLIVGVSFVAIVGCALLVYRIFFVKLIRVPTGAMANTIIPGDHLIVQKLLGDVNRGDIVIFQYPDGSAVQYVARVVGLPGERIQARGYLVNVNGVPIPEQRVLVTPSDDLAAVMEERTTEGTGPYRVFYYPHDTVNFSDEPVDAHFGVAEEFNIPANQYFLMGDNRDNSFDSRFRGPVPRELIWGKPTMIYWSSFRKPAEEENVKWDRIGKSVR